MTLPGHVEQPEAFAPSVHEPLQVPVHVVVQGPLQELAAPPVPSVALLIVQLVINRPRLAPATSHFQ